MSESELIVEVDAHDQDLGSAPRSVLHSDPHRFHRSIAIVIFTSGGKIVLQKRSSKKIGHPGIWTFTGGHQKAGQSVLDTAQTECREELGISPQLKLGGKTIYHQSNQTEFVYVFWGIHNGPYTRDPEEVEAVDVFDIAKYLSGSYPQIGIPHPVDIEMVNMLKPIWSKITSPK